MGEQSFHPLKNLPGCMMPDGGECCAGYTALAGDWHKQHEALKGVAVVANTAGSLLKAQDEKIAALAYALKDWLAFAEEELGEFDLEICDVGDAQEALCHKCESSGCINLKIRNAREALAKAATS